MTLANVISRVLHGNLNFCFICFEEVGENAVHLDDEVLIDTKLTENMGLILLNILGDEISSSISELLCLQCKNTAIENYKFMKLFKQNSINLQYAIELLHKSFEYTTHCSEDYNSLYVSLDITEYTTQQFYDEKKILNPLKAHRRFRSIVNQKAKTRIRQSKPTGNSSLLEYKNRFRIIQNTNREPKLTYESYNIPSVPTVDMIHNINNPLDFKCKGCLKKFIEEKKLRLHYFKKHYPQHVKCSKCPKKFTSEELCQYHEETMHCVGVCSECGKHFPTKLRLAKHELGHKIKITCEECGRAYRSKEAFKKHITDQICQQKMKKNSEQGIYQCDYCKKRYWHKPYLAKHIHHEHGNAVGYRCEFCSKQFYDPSRLQTHLVKHTHEKKFLCTLCNGKFVTKTSLLYHTRLHTGEKPYQCEFCSCSFLNASRRLDHTRRHHLPPSLECELCKVMFKSTGSLLKHKKRHLNPNSRLHSSHRFIPPLQETEEPQSILPH